MFMALAPSRSHKSKSRYSGVRARTCDSNSSSSDDNSYASSKRRFSKKNNRYIEEESSGESEEVIAVSFFERKKGPSHPFVETIRPADPLFDRLMNYRYYRLLNRRKNRGDSLFDLRKYIKALDITLQDYKFDGSDPIMVFDFLTRFVEEADTLNMTEAQAFIVISHYLKGEASNQFRANKNGARSGGVSNWPGTINHFLSTYATPDAISRAVSSFKDISQRQKETEMEFATRLNEAAYRCGNVFDSIEKMSQFVYGLSPTIRTIVQRFRETTPRRELIFDKIVQFARAEGDAHRARTSNLRLIRTVSNAKSGRNVHFLSDESAGASDAIEQVMMVQEDSINTSELPNSEQELSEEIMFTQQTSQIKPAHIPYGDKQTIPTRVGWLKRTDRPTIVCYSCYKKNDHKSPDCTLPLPEMYKIITNYEALSEEERSKIPDTS